MLGNHSHCAADDNVRIGLNKVYLQNADYGETICPSTYIEN